MDVHQRPSGIQVKTKASQFIQRVSHFRPKFKLNSLRLRDDSDLDQPYSQHHKRAQSEAVMGINTGGTDQDDETCAYKPYMSQPLLTLDVKAEEPVYTRVDDMIRTRARIHEPTRVAEEAEAAPPPRGALSSYDTQLPAPQIQSERSKSPVGPLNAVRFPVSQNVRRTEEPRRDLYQPGGGEHDKLKITSITSPKDNNDMHVTTTTKKQIFGEDDVPLIWDSNPLVQGRGQFKPPVGQPTSAGSHKSSPRIVISYSEGAEVRYGEGKGSITQKRFSNSLSHGYPTFNPRLQERNLPPLPLDAARGNLASSTGQPPPLTGTSSASSNRPPVPPLSISPRLSRRISVDKDGSILRFSPSIVTRHPALPLKLPALPPLSDVGETTESQTISNRKRDSRIGLRSLPALPHSGPSNDAAAHEETEDGEDDDQDEDEDEGDSASGSQGDEQGQSPSKTSHSDPMSLSSIGSDPSVRSQSETSSFTMARGGVTHQFQDLPRVDTSGLGLSFQDQSPTPISNAKGKGKAKDDPSDNVPTPTSRLQKEYFSIGAAGASSVTLAPKKRVSTTQAKVDQRRMSALVYSLQAPLAGLKTVPLPPIADSERPGMYKRASQSMVNLNMLFPIEDPAKKLDNPGQERLEVKEVQQKAGIPEDPPPSPKIVRRRRSLPSYYGPTSPPPPYPTFSPFRTNQVVVQPREDEGRERLPSYSNHIYLKTIMPRKMEFSKPSVQARDRKWRRSICVLEGTMFRVYRCPPRVAGLSRIEGWWEKRVGVGDASTSNTSYVTATNIINGPSIRAQRRSVSPPRDQNKQWEQQENRPSAIVTITPPPSSDFSTAEPKRSRLAFLKGRSHARSRSDASYMTSSTAQISPRGSLNLPRTSASASSMSSRAPSPGPSGTLSSFSPSQNSIQSSELTSPERPSMPLPLSGDEVPDPEPSDLIRTYSLQNAECGLGLDYTKRKNVIRVKMEGEQFLLQAKDAMAVVAWIEGIQSGADVALDLDERPMPRGPLFPRRRRRRARVE